MAYISLSKWNVNNQLDICGKHYKAQLVSFSDGVTTVRPRVSPVEANNRSFWNEGFVRQLYDMIFTWLATGETSQYTCMLYE